jgi:predicted nucleic acid-binding protein
VRLLLDTNVILDALLDRAEFVGESAGVMAQVERGRAEGFLCATAITTIHYLVSKQVGPARAKESIRSLLRLFQVAPVNGAVLASALESRARDYEDAVVLESARLVGADAIVTRNQKDFPKTSGIAIHAPGDVLRLLGHRHTP